MAEPEAWMKRNVDDTSSSSSLFKSAKRPVTLTFEDVAYKVKIQKGGMFHKGTKPEEKIILNGVTGIAKPGEMLAMLGPSGSGKTTLLTALGGRLGSRLEGSITYNDKKFSNKIQRNTGFVTQDDILYEHLTVRETLIFTALLRLPKTLTKQEKVRHVEDVISQLGLNKCKNNIIGGLFLRGVSGGERKRVSIGQEMLINPSLLFLDEPTSGLDSTTAQRIVTTLFELTKGGRTIVMTIHQPSSRIFYLFNKVLLLSEGNVTYFGKTDQVMDYFSSVGFTPYVAMNPSDFLLDLANGISRDDSTEDRVAVKQTLISAYKTNLYAQVQRQCLEYSNTQITQGGPGHDQHRVGGIHNRSSIMAVDDKSTVISSKWPTTWWNEFKVLLVRGLRERRHEAFDVLKITQMLAITIITGLIWSKSNKNFTVLDKVGLLFFYTMLWEFNPLYNAIFAFPKERNMLAKERASGMYRLSSYFLSRIISDIPMELTLPTIFLVVVYWMAGLNPTAGSFFYNFGVLLLNVLVAQGMGLALGAAFLDQQKATCLANVLTMIFMTTGGFFVQNVAPYLKWIKYLSISQHAFKLFVASQYGYDDTYPCDAPGRSCLVREIPTVKAVGLHGQATAAIILLAMFVGYRLIAYVALMHVGRTPN